MLFSLIWRDVLKDYFGCTISEVSKRNLKVIFILTFIKRLETAEYTPKFIDQLI